THGWGLILTLGWSDKLKVWDEILDNLVYLHDEPYCFEINLKTNGPRKLACTLALDLIRDLQLSTVPFEIPSEILASRVTKAMPTINELIRPSALDFL